MQGALRLVSITAYGKVVYNLKLGLNDVQMYINTFVGAK